MSQKKTEQCTAQIPRAKGDIMKWLDLFQKQPESQKHFPYNAII